MGALSYPPFNVKCRKARGRDSISPLEGEMPGRAEGGAAISDSSQPFATAPGVRRSKSQIVGFSSAAQTAPHSAASILPAIRRDWRDRVS